MKRRIRFAVVGLGHIAQVAVLPAFAHAPNAECVALVSGDRTKRRLLGARYGIDQLFDYKDYERCLAMVDAVYIALPNSMHAEYAIRAARAGVHVLCEKPLAPTAAECQQIVRACRRAGTSLMVAYRLHFDPMNLAAIEIARSGRLGDLKYFNSSFSQMVRRGDIRTKKALDGGTLYDIGVYCINAARYLFRAEPVEVMAMSVPGTGRLKEIDATTTSVLRFPGDRIASFVTSFDSVRVSSYRIVGSKGDLHAEPAYGYVGPLKYTLTTNGTPKPKTFRPRDQFGAELDYFADCILKGREPEPSGEEGLQDVRIIEALYKAARTGRRVTLSPFSKGRRPGRAQRMAKPPVKKPRLVKVKSPST